MIQPRALFEAVGGTTAVRLRIGRTGRHRNAVPCVILSHGQGIAVETAEGTVHADAVFVGAGWDHTVDFFGGSADVIYLETPLAVCDSDGPATGLSRELTRFLERSVECWSDDAAMELLDRLGPSPHRDDPAMARIMQHIQFDPMARLSETAAARLVGIERTTMLRRFKRQVGMTFRAYKNWTALKHASRLAQKGEALGAAGLDAGFADAAHFSRRFGSTFGLTPTVAIRSLL
jgi:AraC-like DNA-binding protein